MERTGVLGVLEVLDVVRLRTALGPARLVEGRRDDRGSPAGVAEPLSLIIVYSSIIISSSSYPPSLSIMSYLPNPPLGVREDAGGTPLPPE